MNSESLENTRDGISTKPASVNPMGWLEEENLVEEWPQTSSIHNNASSSVSNDSIPTKATATSSTNTEIITTPNASVRQSSVVHRNIEEGTTNVLLSSVIQKKNVKSKQPTPQWKRAMERNQELEQQRLGALENMFNPPTVHNTNKPDIQKSVEDPQKTSRAASNVTNVTNTSSNSPLKLFGKHDTYTNQKLGNLLDSLNDAGGSIGTKSSTLSNGSKMSVLLQQQLQQSEEDDKYIASEVSDVIKEQEYDNRWDSTDRRGYTTQEFFSRADSIFDNLKIQQPEFMNGEGSVTVDESSLASETNTSSHVPSQSTTTYYQNQRDASSRDITQPSTSGEDATTSSESQSQTRYPSVIVHPQNEAKSNSPETSSQPVSPRKNMGVILKTDQQALAISHQCGSMIFDSKNKKWKRNHDPSNHRSSENQTTSNNTSSEYVNNSVSSDDVFQGIDDLESSQNSGNQNESVATQLARNSVKGVGSLNSRSTLNKNSIHSAARFGMAKNDTPPTATSQTTSTFSSYRQGGPLASMSQISPPVAEYPSLSKYKPVHKSISEIEESVDENGMSLRSSERSKSLDLSISQINGNNNSQVSDWFIKDINSGLFPPIEKNGESSQVNTALSKASQNRSWPMSVTSSTPKFLANKRKGLPNNKLEVSFDMTPIVHQHPSSLRKNAVSTSTPAPDPKTKPIEAATPSELNITVTPRDTTRISSVGDISYRHAKSELIQQLTNRYVWGNKADDDKENKNSDYRANLDLGGRIHSDGNIQWETLTIVDLSRCQLKALVDLKSCCPKIRSLNVSHNLLTSLIGVPTGVTELNASFNKLDKITATGGFSELKFLQVLDISGNKDIEDLTGLSHLVCLQKLTANHCGIQSLLTSVGTDGFAKHLCSLKTLKLSHNNLKGAIDLKTDAGFTSVSQLEELNLSNNSITDIINLSTLKKIQFLNLGQYNFVYFKKKKLCLLTNKLGEMLSQCFFFLLVS